MQQPFEEAAHVIVYCDHAGRPEADRPERDICHAESYLATDSFTSWGTPTADGELRRWRQVMEPGHLQTHQMYFGEAVRLTRSMPREERSAITRSPAKMARLLSNRRDGRVMSNRWRFHCEVCRDTFIVPNEKMMTVLEALRQNGISRLTLAQLRRIPLA